MPSFNLSTQYVLAFLGQGKKKYINKIEGDESKFMQTDKNKE